MGPASARPSRTSCSFTLLAKTCRQQISLSRVRWEKCKNKTHWIEKKRDVEGWVNYWKRASDLGWLEEAHQCVVVRVVGYESEPHTPTHQIADSSHPRRRHLDMNAVSTQRVSWRSITAFNFTKSILPSNIRKIEKVCLPNEAELKLEKTNIKEQNNWGWLAPSISPVVGLGHSNDWMKLIEGQWGGDISTSTSASWRGSSWSVLRCSRANTGLCSTCRRVKRQRCDSFNLFLWEINNLSVSHLFFSIALTSFGYDHVIIKGVWKMKSRRWVREMKIQGRKDGSSTLPAGRVASCPEGSWSWPGQGRCRSPKDAVPPRPHRSPCCRRSGSQPRPSRLPSFLQSRLQ